MHSFQAATGPIAALIDQSNSKLNYWLHHHHIKSSASKMNGWIAIWPGWHQGKLLEGQSPPWGAMGQPSQSMFFLDKYDRKADFNNSHAWQIPHIINLSLSCNLKMGLPPETPIPLPPLADLASVVVEYLIHCSLGELVHPDGPRQRAREWNQ